MSLMRRLQKTRSISDIDDIMRNMKIFRNIGLAALAASFLSACVRENIDPDGIGMKISLGAKVNAVVLSTKAAIDHNYQSENGLPINLIRWDENESEETAGRDELSATLDGTYGTSYQREIDITPVQFYKDRESEVGFAGWYPAKDAGHCRPYYPAGRITRRPGRFGREYPRRPAKPLALQPLGQQQHL